MRFIFLLVLTGFLARSLVAQEPHRFSMEEAVTYGFENHQEMQIAENELEKARQQMVEARSIGLPQVNAGVDYSHFLKLPTSLIPAQFINPSAPEGEFLEVSFGTKNNLTANGSVRTLIFDGSYFLALKASREYIEFSRMNYENSRTGIRNAVKKAYLPPLLIQQNIETIDKNISALEKLLFETNEMYKSGFVEKMDVDKLFLTVDNMKVLKKDLEKNLKLAKDALKMEMGYPLDQAIELSESIEDLAAELNEVWLTGKMEYDRRTEYHVLDYSEKLSELNVEQYKRGYWPSLSGFINYQQVVQGDNLFDGAISTPASAAGLSLKVPIFDGFYRKSRIQQAKLDMSNVSHQKEMLKKGMDFQLKAARENYLNALENIQSRKRNMDLAADIFSTAQVKYKEGVGSSLEIIQAEQSLHDSQQNYLTALYEFILAKIDVEIALGKE